MDGSRNETVDALRGLAALGVCIFHLCSPTSQPILHSIFPVSAVTHYGLFGVTVFFVMSGFIIPYMMDRAAYEIRFFPRFLLRRLARLEPPYLASIAFVLLLGFAGAASPGFRGQPFEFDLPQTLSHVGYLTGILGYPWLNIVYWTLAIEFQFYILIAIFFPLLATRRPAAQTGVIIVCAAAPLLTPSIPAPTAEAFFPTLILPPAPCFCGGRVDVQVADRTSARCLVLAGTRHSHPPDRLARWHTVRICSGGDRSDHRHCPPTPDTTIGVSGSDLVFALSRARPHQRQVVQPGKSTR